MERTNFENLQIYKLSEKLSDQLWRIVIRWDVLARTQSASNLYEQVTVSALTLPKEVEEGPTQRCVDF